MALRRTLACFFPLWSHFSFSLCLSDIKSDVTVRTRLGAHNSASPLQSPWDKIRRVSLNLILSLSLLSEPVSISVSKFFFLFFCLKVNILTSPLSRTPFHTSPDNFRNFPETGSLISTQKVSRRASVWTFLLVFSFFFLLSAFGVYNRVAPTT